MNGLCVALMVLLVLLLLGQIRIGVQVEYCEQGLFVRVRAGVFLIPVFPLKKKIKEKKLKPAKGKNKPDAKKGGLLKLALEFIPLVLDTVKKLRRKLRVDKLDMELVVCAPDPADAAIRYGQANALLGTLWQPMTQALHVKDGHAHVGVDFNARESTVYILADATLTIAQTLCLAVVFAARALGILIHTRSKRATSAQQGEAV